MPLFLRPGQCLDGQTEDMTVWAEQKGFGSLVVLVDRSHEALPNCEVRPTEAEEEAVQVWTKPQQ